MPAPKPRYPRRPSVASQIEQELKKGNSNLEFSFVKAPREKIINSTGIQHERSVAHDSKKIDKYVEDILLKKHKEAEKTGNYKPWAQFLEKKSLIDIHTHPSEGLFVPSHEDLIKSIYNSSFGKNAYSTTIVKTKGEKVMGKLQFTIDPKKIPIEFKRKLIESSNKAIVAIESGHPELVPEIKKNTLDILTDYLDKARQDYFKMDEIRIVPKEFHDLEIEQSTRLDMVKYMYKKIGILIHYSSNKGYYLDKNKLKFMEIGK